MNCLLANAKKGGMSAAEKAFLALAPTNAGKVDIPGLLRHLETLHAYTIREMGATGLSGSKKESDSLDYSRISELDPQYFPFLKTPITTDDGFVVNADESLRTRLMREAKLLSERTDPGTVHVADTKRFLQQMVELDVRGAPPNEKLAVQDLHAQIMDGVKERQIEQTETMTNAQIVEMVENVIRDNPQDFPLLTKYYLNAE